MAAGKKILVVDDDTDVQLFCKTVLEAKGYLVTSVGSAKAAPAAIKTGQPDLIILDVMMEEVDSGFKLAMQIKDTPVVILSSIADASTQNLDTSSLPASELVQKPIKPAELLAKVKALVG